MAALVGIAVLSALVALRPLPAVGSTMPFVVAPAVLMLLDWAVVVRVLGSRTLAELRTAREG